MFISIIITSYNYAEFLNDCIDSCLRQEYKDNMEIIVVDDGSHDDSRKIILEYNSRIKHIFKSNGGQASAFNTGYSACSGDIIIFLDSDDMLMPNCLDKISQNWKGSFSKIHYNLLMIDQNGVSLGETFCKNPLPRGDLKAAMLKNGNYQSMPTSGNAFSRAFLNKVMPMPEADWRGHSDAYLFNLAPLAGSVGAIDEPLGFYRIHDKNLGSYFAGTRLHFDKLHAAIVREVNTDELLSNFSKNNGLKYDTGVLCNSYPHLQQVMLHDKLAHLYKHTRYRSPWIDFAKMSISILKLRNISYVKLLLIHQWMFLILISPSKLAEKMVIFGFEKGAMLFAKRSPRKKIAAISSAGYRAT